MNEDIDPEMARAERIAQRFLRPARPRLADAMELATGFDRALIDEALASSWAIEFSKHHATLTWATKDAQGAPCSRYERAPKDRIRDPVEAWEMLVGRGVIPDDWMGTNARRFALGQHGATPASMMGVVTIASDPDGILEAERLAREVAGRLVDWGVGRAPRVVWHVDVGLHWIRNSASPERASRTDLALPGGDVLHELLGAVGYAVPQRSFRRGRRGARAEIDDVTAPAAKHLAKLLNDAGTARPLVNLLDAHFAWQRARRANVLVRVAKAHPETGALAMREIGASELPDPFEPLLLLIERGYLLLELTRRSIQLYAPTRACSDDRVG